MVLEEGGFAEAVNVKYFRALPKLASCCQCLVNRCAISKDYSAPSPVRYNRYISPRGPSVSSRTKPGAMEASVEVDELRCYRVYNKYLPLVV